MLLILLTVAGCRQDYSPKPDGYLRIDPHPKAYKLIDKTGFPLSFEISQSAQGIIDNSVASAWINIIYPRYKATVYCTYIPIDKKIKPVFLLKVKSLYIVTESRRKKFRLNCMKMLNGIYMLLYIR